MTQSSNQTKDRVQRLGKVAVLMGGVAAERDVSLRSGAEVLKALKSEGVDAVGCDVTSVAQLVEIAQKYDRAFIALHGRWGEDGGVQAVLDSLALPYTGSGMTASALAMDKLRTKWLWKGVGLPTPAFIVVSPSRPLDVETFDLTFPVIVKPSHEGSSIGMRKVDTLDALQEAVDFAQQYDSEILIEQWITGREFTCAVLDGEALPMIQLKTDHDFYDFDAKYQSNTTEYLCPCGLEIAEEKRIQALVLQAFDAVGARHWGRVDLMLDDQNQPWLIEINTVPGMTDHSLVPMAAKAVDLSFSKLVLKLISLTLP
uniref:D-alanine--D-alanine ligase n=1 Tax=Hydrogenovibrio crunogenus (strain DSM 25203 / XCL-2) TaxID=317025 RepID=DDL_HYDCU|nr:RecName: Full=D-alanine--D-alanine ligase; AltName: Full=D-Ala-D-Ala ligase; AltName: Full=D-alanylalanine synthetase [Hydrogenovibrio crunogenus XCL-2]